MALSYINLVKENKAEFESKVRTIAKYLGINPDWLMIVFYAESKVNHRAVNSASGATGLIQFLPSTAKGLNTTTAQLRAMSNVQQLDYVLRYFNKYKGKLNTAYDVYLAVFYPARIGANRNTVVFKAGSISYKQNAGLDLDKNGDITVGNIQDWFDKYIPPGVATGTPVNKLLRASLIVGGGYLTYKLFSK